MLKLEIRRLTPDMLNDYMHFSLEVAFTDHPEWAGCCCVHFHWNDKYEAEFKNGAKSGTDWAVEMVNTGVIQGYLAYADGQVVGWCNANDRRNYDVLKTRNEIWEENNNLYKILKATHQTELVICMLPIMERYRFSKSMDLNIIRIWETMLS